jgi:peptidylamidoglycolate lyase
MRILKNFIYLILLLIVVVIAAYFLQNKKKGEGNDKSIRYELVKHWIHLPENIHLGNPTGLSIDTNQHIVIFHRADREWPLIGSMPESYINEKTILIIDKETGSVINSWGAGLFIMPHGLTVDDQNNVWVTDVGLHQVFKFSIDGKLLMKLGEAKVSDSDAKHFNQPTDVAVSDDGSFYVSDGYGNSRIIKFSAEGKYLFEWGRKGKSKGEFDIPHAITIDVSKNVLVADRENNRIQVFDAQGKYLREYNSDNYANITSVYTDRTDNKLFFIDDLSFLKLIHRGSDIFSMDSTGLIQSRFGRSGSYDGPVCWFHDIVVDNEQNIYVGDIKNNQLLKFKKLFNR